MVINCNINKTEVICFNCPDISAVPTSYSLCGNTILLTDNSKVLGITLDRKLNYKQHSQEVFNKLIYKWVSMSRYANRNWGMSQKVIVRLTKAILFSSLFYGSLIWQNNSNMTDLNRLWYRVAKAAVGAVFNVQHAILEVILGIPPLNVTSRILAVKHYLKVLNSPKGDAHREFIQQEINTGNTTVLTNMRDVLKFLKWKVEMCHESFNSSDTNALGSNDLLQLFNLSKKIMSLHQRLSENVRE